MRPAIPTSWIRKEQNHQLENYILTASDIYLGLSPIKVSKLAYTFAMASNVQYNWAETEMASVDCFDAFLKKAPLSVNSEPQRPPTWAIPVLLTGTMQASSLPNFEPQSIWNMDETGIPQQSTSQIKL